MPTIESLEARVQRLDAELAAVRRDLHALRTPAAPPPPPAPTPPTFRVPPPPPPVRTAPPAATRPSIQWEDLLAGRVMAWVGGAAVLVGLVFFLALAVSRGWIGEEARTAMAAVASLMLIVGGARAYERRGRTEAALAATGAGIAGGFATLAVACEVYGLVPAAVGLPLGLLLGAASAVLAMRWRSRTVAVLGIAGGLLSPALAGADLQAFETIALLTAGYAGAVAVCVVLGWAWLGLLAFALVTPQWLAHVLDDGPRPDALPVVIAFALLGAAAAVGFSLRTRAPGFRPGSHLLLALNAMFATFGGSWALEGFLGGEGLHGETWLCAVAIAHLAGGLAALHSRRVERTLALAMLGIGIILADIALAELVDGLALPLVWAASAALFALLARHHPEALAGLGGHLALAIGHVLAQDAPFGDLGGGGSPEGLVATTAIAAVCLVSSRVADARVRGALELTGLLAVAYATALALDGAALSAAWAAEAAALARLKAQPAAIAFFSGALLCALGTVAPVIALADGVDDLPAALFALLAVAGAALALRSPAGAGVVLLYLASVTAVTLVDGQAGQFALSALWCITGLGALAAGVVRDDAALRAGALSLLALATAKVFVVDLAALDAMARVGSFLVLGTLLLAGAFAWQRAKPTTPQNVESDT